MPLPEIRSIQVGLPRQMGVADAADPMDRIWTTSAFKQGVSGPVWLRFENLDGDRQADLIHHGGPEKAVLACSLEHYPFWRQQMGNIELPLGAFGENFTLSNLSEAEVNIGDTWATLDGTGLIVWFTRLFSGDRGGGGWIAS